MNIRLWRYCIMGFTAALFMASVLMNPDFSERSGYYRVLWPYEIGRTTPIRVGEDCSRKDTACNYFRPRRFSQERPVFMAEMAGSWGAFRKKKMESICKKVNKRLSDLYNIQCAEQGISPAGKYCRPQDFDVVTPDPEKEPLLFLPQNITYKHTHTSQGNAFLPLLGELGANGLPQFRVSSIRHGSADRIEQRTRYHAIDIERAQQEGAGHPLVAVVENPVVRFVSIATQLLKDSPAVIASCGSIGSRSAQMHCVLDAVGSSPRLHNMDIVPTFVEIYCGTKGYDVEVSLYSTENFSELMDAFGASAVRQETVEKSEWFTISDLDDDAKRRICHLYAWDVLMMKDAGFDVPECKEFPYKTGLRETLG